MILPFPTTTTTFRPAPRYAINDTEADWSSAQAQVDALAAANGGNGRNLSSVVSVKGPATPVVVEKKRKAEDAGGERKKKGKKNEGGKKGGGKQGGGKK